MAEHARMLFQRGWLHVAGYRSGHASLDGAYLCFLIEELVAQSALEVVIPQQSIPGMVVDRMPEGVRKYIRTIDGSPARRRCFNVLAPVADELGLELDGDDRRSRGRMDPEAFNIAVSFFDGFEIFLRGIDHRAAVDLDVAELRTLARFIRERLNGTDGRDVLARIEGLLTTYETIEVPTLRSISRASPEQVKAFQRLLEDREYIELSSNALELGLPLRIGRAGQIMRRAIEAIVTRAPFKQLFTLAGRGITVATGAPIPDDEAVQGFLTSGYLPPAIPLRQAMADAAKFWRTAKTEFIPFPGLEE